MPWWRHRHAALRVRMITAAAAHRRNQERQADRVMTSLSDQGSFARRTLFAPTMAARRNTGAVLVYPLVAKRGSTAGIGVATWPSYLHDAAGHPWHDLTNTAASAAWRRRDQETRLWSRPQTIGGVRFPALANRIDYKYLAVPASNPYDLRNCSIQRCSQPHSWQPQQPPSAMQTRLLKTRTSPSS